MAGVSVAELASNQSLCFVLFFPKTCMAVLCMVSLRWSHFSLALVAGGSVSSKLERACVNSAALSGCDVLLTSMRGLPSGLERWIFLGSSLILSDLCHNQHYKRCE